MTDTNQTAKSLPHYHIDHTLYQGRPSDLTGRLAKEIRTYDLLDSLGVSYTRVDHDALPTIEACLEVDRLLGSEICKNLFLRNAQKTDFYLLLMPGNKKFKTALLSKQIGSARLSFGEPEFMEEFMDLTPGSVTVMGLMNDKAGRVRLLIDKDILDGKSFGCHPCMNTTSLKIKTDDILKKFLKHTGHRYRVVSALCGVTDLCDTK